MAWVVLRKLDENCPDFLRQAGWRPLRGTARRRLDLGRLLFFLRGVVGVFACVKFYLLFRIVRDFFVNSMHHKSIRIAFAGAVEAHSITPHGARPSIQCGGRLRQ
jgi:hypothetical protein